MRTRISITIIGALAALALVAVPAASGATDVHRATLQGSAAFPAAKGSAKFSRDDGVKQLEAEVQHVKSLAGTKVRFLVKGISVGTAEVTALGTARIDESGGSVPAVTTGSRIRVERLNEALVASGRFS